MRSRFQPSYGGLASLEQQVAQVLSVGHHFRHQPEVLPRIDESGLMFDFSVTSAADVLSRATSYKHLVEFGMDSGKAAGVSGLMALEGEA